MAINAKYTKHRAEPGEIIREHNLPTDVIIGLGGDGLLLQYHLLEKVTLLLTLKIIRNAILEDVIHHEKGKNCGPQVNIWKH